MKYAVNKPVTRTDKSSAGSLANNIRAWSLYIDLLENCGEFEDTKWAYERIIDAKIATAETILNFTGFLQRNNFYEESFRVFEKAVQLFDWPHLYEIWVEYLSCMI